jgi:hypothetical protein
MVRMTQQPNKRRSRTPEAQKLYRQLNGLAVGADADRRRSKERTQHRERQARARSQPPPPTLSHDQLSARRIHQLELHRDRQWEYRARLRARREPPPSHVSPQPGDSMLVDVPKLQPASAPSVPSPSRSDRVREANRIKQQRWRANRQAQPVHLPAVQIDDRAPPPYLPVHQQVAIHAFLDRVRELGDDISDCEMCKEHYYGMKLQGGLCARCAKEVCHANSSDVFLLDSFPLFFNRLCITTPMTTTPTPATSRLTFTTSLPTSHKWRKCFAASPRPAL